MNKLKIAKIISTLTNPPIICIPLFFIICLVLSFENGTFDFSKFMILELISLIFASALPMAIILLWAKKLNTDSDISNREDRFTPLIVGIISYFIGFLVLLTLGFDDFLTALLLCYSINTGVILLITTKWKISVHTTGLSGPVAALILLLGPIGALFGILYPILIWSRVLLKKHTLAQAIAGGVQGFFLTVLEMYLFINLFNFNVFGLTPLLDSIWFILAIIFTPVILGFLSYSDILNKKRLFILLEIIGLVLFLAFTPLDVFVIYIIVSLASILITLYAGEDYVWFNVLKSS
jgi:membrane-associated phospholipid phosphatase